MNGDYLHVDLPATVIKDSVSDAMIVQQEAASDSNPWENVDHNDTLCLETTATAPSLSRVKEGSRGDVGEEGKKSNFLFLSILINVLEISGCQGVLSGKEKSKKKNLPSNKTDNAHFIADCMMKYLRIA